MIEFRSHHRVLARDRQPLQFVDGRIVVNEAGAAKLRRLAARRPYLGIKEIGPVRPAPVKKGRAKKAAPKPGPAPVEPAIPAEAPAPPAEDGAGDSPVSDNPAGDGE